MLQISRQSIEEGEEKYEENKTNFEGTCFGNSLVDSAQFGIEGAPSQGNSCRNFHVFYLGSVELQMRENGVFFTPVKCILVCHTPQVSWAAQHTTVCLD